MKKIAGIYIFLIVINLVVPLVYCRIYTGLPFQLPQLDTAEKAPRQTDEKNVTLMDKATGRTIEVSLKDYLIGAAACEMPAMYSEEAIKAQMVAAHSYYLYSQNNPAALENGYITVDPANLKGYTDSTRLMEFWKTDYYDYYEKFSKCADRVIDRVVTYDGQPALTSYYAVSCGKTAASGDVWGQSLPYLVSVDSGQDRLSGSYIKITEFPKDNMYSLLRIKYPNIKLEEDKPESWFGDVIYTESGYASYVTVGSDLVPAGQIRDIMGLPSTCMMIFYEEETFSVATKGYGHGVGLSQYGANCMAQEGKDYRQILAHYFPGTKLETL